MLVPQPGNEPVSPALEAQSLNHWTAREVPHFLFLNCIFNLSMSLVSEEPNSLCL